MMRPRLRKPALFIVFFSLLVAANGGFFGWGWGTAFLIPILALGIYLLRDRTELARSAAGPNSSVEAGRVVVMAAALLPSIAFIGGFYLFGALLRWIAQSLGAI